HPSFLPGVEGRSDLCDAITSPSRCPAASTPCRTAAFRGHRSERGPRTVRRHSWGPSSTPCPRVPWGQSRCPPNRQPNSAPTASSAAAARGVRVRMVSFSDHAVVYGGPGTAPGPRDNRNSTANAFSLREAEQRFRLLQPLQVPGPELLRLEVDLDLLDRPRESKRRLVGVAHR